MANESLISVPPDVNNPRVLQRFLSRLVEQLDIVLGNRASESYVSQQELVAQANILIDTITQAELTLNTIVDRLETASESELEQLETRIASVEAKNTQQDTVLTNLRQVTPVKAAMLSFNGSLSFLVNFNIDSLTKIGVGLYECVLVSSTFNGVDILDNSIISTDFQIGSSSDLFEILIVDISNTTFRIQVIEQTAGAYDLAAGDIVDVMMLIDLPTTSLPAGFDP